jgi:hypothetical protein
VVIHFLKGSNNGRRVFVYDHDVAQLTSLSLYVESPPVLEVLAKHVAKHLNTLLLVLKPEEGYSGRRTVEYKGSVKRTGAILQGFGLESDFDIRTNVFFAGYFHLSAHAGRLYNAVNNRKAQSCSSL